MSLRRGRLPGLMALALLACLLLLAFALQPAAGNRSAAARQAQVPPNWQEMAPQGFGDRQNSHAWSMQWWRGRLYVGTLRSFVCWRAAIWASALPGLGLYPPNHPDADCTPDPADLPMQAEIWRWTPETDTWDRVYQSPQDVPIPNQPGKFVARDTGFRGMLVYTEPGGTEALYVAGVSPREMYGNSPLLPPPRLLRSTDGETFTPVPQALGSVMGDLVYTGLRTGTIFDGRMYLTNGTARGEGVLLESANPAAGNNAFREVLPPGTLVWDAISFNGSLYIGLISSTGFSVVKTDAQGSPPYALTTLIPDGGYLPNPSQSIVSLHEFQGSLYVGTYLPAELYRILPDDSWELVMGDPRQGPAGWIYPTSGLDPGFGWPYNVQIYRMFDYRGALYLGTLDLSREVTEINPDPAVDALLRWQYGFDLYRTEDGRHFQPLTITGFDDEFQIAVRTFAATPHGLIMGTGSYWYGLRLWRRDPEFDMWLPLIAADATPSARISASPAAAGSACPDAPRELAAEMSGDDVLLSWKSSAGSRYVHVYRSEVAAGLPSEYVAIGRTPGDAYRDQDLKPGHVAYYTVAAEGTSGCRSLPSNVVRVPSLAPAALD